jgi:hypothetical protein
VKQKGAKLTICLAVIINDLGEGCRRVTISKMRGTVREEQSFNSLNRLFGMGGLNKVLIQF